MKFTKMQGIGNDYIYVNCFEEKVENPSELSIKLSDRHFGIGSDGLIMIAPSKVADFQMIMYNADGSKSGMCGNGIRCVGKYVYDKKLTDKTEITIETLSGIKNLKLNIENGKVKTVTVNMGNPILKPELIPVTLKGENVINHPVIIDDNQYNITCVSVGNPHAVVYVEETESLDLEKIGPKFENFEIFPERVNTEFVQVIDRTHLKMRVWERGSGETFACGTGSCAVLVASVLNNKSERCVEIELLGGNLNINWDEETGDVFMTGAAEIVFEGDIEI